MTQEATVVGKPFRRALKFAMKTHQADVRKSAEGERPIPYVAHLLGVASLVLEDGGSETEAIGALLHDCAEDHGGEPMLARIEHEFGAEVAEIVRGCSDSLLSEGQPKQEWLPRKLDYVAMFDAKDHEPTLRVSNADKLHNARAILTDYRRHREELWERFTTRSGVDQIRYYEALARAFARKRPGSVLAGELTVTVAALRAEFEERNPGALAGTEDPFARIGTSA